MSLTPAILAATAHPSPVRLRYTCKGAVRGPCGIQHRTLRAAAACCDRDHAGCRRSQGGYSDRVPGVVEGGHTRPLTDDERDEMQAYRDGA